MAADKRLKSNEEITADEELEDLFGDFEGTLQCKLTRLEPEYAEGYCGKFNVTAGRPLTAHEIKTRFGGKVFQMIARDSGGKYVKKKIISISGLPKDEGRVVNPDGSLQPTGDSDQGQKTGGTMDPLEALMNAPLTSKAKRLLAQEVLGLSGNEEKEKSSATVEMFNMQMMMEFQQKMRESALRQEKMSAEMERESFQWRREMAQQDKPKDTMGGMHDMVKVFREMNGLKEEFGGSGNESAMNTIISNTMPMIETMMAEFMKLKQMQVQMQLSQTTGQQNTQPPELPARAPQQSAVAPVRVVEDTGDPVAMARKMGLLFAKAPDELKPELMKAFFQGDQNVESIPYDDTIDDDDDGDDEIIMDEADREIWNNGADNEQNEHADVSDREHPRSIDDNDPDNRQGNQSGGTVSTN